MGKKIIQFKDKNKCINMFKDYVGKKETPENIVKGLSVLSAWCLTIDENNIDEVEDAIIEFGDYFYKNYINRKGVVDAILENWGGLPRIIRMADVLRDQRDFERYTKKYEKLSKEKQETINKLIDYIWNFRLPRAVSIYPIINDENTLIDYDNVGLHLELEKTIRRDELEECFNALKLMILRVFFENGCILFTRIDKEMQITNGFLLESGVLEIVDKKYATDDVVSLNKIFETAILD